jgi:hypothetical protein
VKDWGDPDRWEASNIVIPATFWREYHAVSSEWRPVKALMRTTRKGTGTAAISGIERDVNLRGMLRK